MKTQDRVGQQFGNYHLKALIGQGGYAEVYLAEHIYFSHLQHAIKIFKDPEFQSYNQDTFQLEATAITNLQRLSPHIVQIRDAGIQMIKEGGSESAIPYIVMEYASAGTLRNLCPSGTQMPLERIAFYTKQVAQALQCAHDQTPPIIHRDIKPENMLLRNIDHVLLSDFGISVTNQTGLQGGFQEKGLVGTAAYIAPERFSHQLRRASDQYSLAIVVYEWISGVFPFDGTLQEIYLKQRSVPPPPLYPTYAHVTPEIDLVVARALEKNPDDRYASVSAFAHALDEAITAALSPQQSLPAPTFQANAAPVIDLLSDVTEPEGFGRTRKNGSHFFAFSSQFARHPRSGLFLGLGLVLNALSAILIGVLLQNVLVLFGSVIYSLLLFTLYIYAVDTKLALFFGSMIALYWCFVGWVIGNFLPSLLHVTNPFSAPFVAFLFLLASMISHTWYVSEKNL